MTKKFPPDFSKLKTMYGSYVKMKEATKEVQMLKDNFNGDEDEVAALIANRKKLSDALADLSLSGVPQPPPPEETREMICQKENQTIFDLKEQVQLLDAKITELSQQILQLKYKDK